MDGFSVKLRLSYEFKEPGKKPEHQNKYTESVNDIKLQVASNPVRGMPAIKKSKAM